jgi:hypothetical protein
MQPPEHREDGPDACALCERTGVPLERHHLVPESRAESPVATVCPPCHRQLHATFTNEELRESYDTVEALRESDRMSAFVSFVSGTDKVDVDVAESEHVRAHRR